MKVTEIQFALNLKALSVPQCRRLVQVLIRGSASPGELSKACKLSPASIEKHLDILKDAGLVKVRKVNGENRVSLQIAKLKPTLAWFLQLKIKEDY